MTFILLPGMHGTHELFAPFISLARRSHTCITVRYPKSQILIRAEYRKLIYEFLPITGDYCLIAESFSGPLAIEIASHPSARLRALILSATFATPPIHSLLIPFAHLLGPLLMRLPPPRFILQHLLLEKTSPPQLLDELMEILRSVSGCVLASRLKIILATNHIQLLANLKIPTLILLAENDRLISKTASTRLINAMPAAKTVHLKSPHLLLQTHPEEALSEIENFLSHTPPTEP